MQEFNIITLLSSFSVEVVAVSVASFVVAFCLKLFFKIGNKYCLVISFLLSLCITFLLELFVFKLDLVTSMQRGITAGAISLVLTSFSKKIAFCSRKDVKRSLEKLLSTIVLSDEMDKVVDEIIEKIKSDTTFNEDSIKTVIKENLSGEIDDEKLELIAKFVLNALNIKND